MKKNLHHVLAMAMVMLGLLSSSASAQKACPAVGADPINVPVSNKPIMKVTLKNFNKLCILVRVTAKTDEADLDAFSLNSPTTDYSLVPIARSYRNKNWEQAAGIYAERSTTIKVLRRKRCTIKFQLKKDTLGEDFRIYIMSLDHPNAPLSADDDLARFLEQATFGPTKSLINEWPTSKKINGYANWLKLQMKENETPMTLHRAYYRERMDHSLKFEAVGVSNFRPQHPCNEYSRWRNYALYGADYGLAFVMEEFEGKLKMSVKVGNVYQVRTVMDEFKTDDVDDEAYNGPGTYQFCWSFGEGVGQPITYRPSPAHPCRNIAGGNPKIYLPDSARTSAMSFIDLPPLTSFDQPPGQLAVDRMLWMGGESHRLLENLWDNENMVAVCDSLSKKNSYGQLHGIVDGEEDGYIWHYAGYSAVEENTIENPLPDGGAYGVQSGMHLCTNVAKDFMNIESCKLSTGPTCVNTSTKGTKTIEQNVVVCGSSGEVSVKLGDAVDFNMAHSFDSGSGVLFGLNEWQKSNLFNNIAINAPDQVRQRMAWALSQILVVTQFQIDNSDLSTEFFLHYHDIFVRNAFGNYRDILKEVSYSPMMGEMLSYINSRSATYVKRWENKDSRPDENFAREIMQLFSIGIYKLEQNGQIITDKAGQPIQSYDNSDIQTFARAWTGFKARNRRGNMEGYWSHPNRIDPMTITGEARDQFPKKALLGGFIGDKYPLCVDLPSKHFLRKGASYRLLGGHNMPEYHYDNPNWENNQNFIRPLLDSSGALYDVLCNDEDDDGTCDFKPLVTLEQNVPCTAIECELDNLRVVKVQESPAIYYEYVRPACVEMAFSDESSLRKVVDRVKDAMCVHEKIDQVAFHTCCPKGNTYARSRCEFSGERVSFATSAERCLNDPEGTDSVMCDWKNIHYPQAQCAFMAGGDYFDWYWTNQSCSIKVKVGLDGMIALVHNPNLDINEELGDDTQKVVEYLNEDNSNFFKILWKGRNYPNPSNNCADTASCVAVPEGCLCDVDMDEQVVFEEAPTKKEVLESFKIGFVDPTSFDDGTFEAPVTVKGVEIYHKVGEPEFSMHTVFGVSSKGEKLYFKNQKSRVMIRGASSFSFRNPPHFMSLAIPDTRDAIYETEAVLDMYFYHPNTAPFLAERLIQRFGISNPSPSYIEAVAKAFRSGFYKFGKGFGDKKYGNLQSTVAAILLYKEARTNLLDADPTAGSLREPFLKYIGILRSMEYLTHEHVTAVRVEDLQQSIGQAPYTIPNVFSFFLPEYSAPGVITNAGLKSPEAQVMNTPTIIGFLNGVFSLIDIGTTSCYSGFGGRSVYWCPGYQRHYTDLSRYSHGRLGFTATNPTVAADVIDELATILTGGRLNSASRATFASEYSTKLGQSDETQALRLAQKLILSTPEFHSTNAVRSAGDARFEAPDPQPSPNDYKAIIFLNLNGGMDGFNMLVPKCSDMYAKYQAARGSDVALPIGSLLGIDATGSGQVCDSFGLHQRLRTLQSLYNDDDLTFIANLGILEQPANATNYREKTKNTALFAHNTQTKEAAAIDIFDEYSGTGIGGRIIEVLNEGIYYPGSISVAGAAPPVVTDASPLLVVDPFSYDKFNPVPWAPDVTPVVKTANADTLVGTGLFGETWSDKLFQSLGENQLLYTKYNGVKLSTAFPNTHHGRQFASIAKLMQTKDDRGKDRDVFFSERAGHDLHFDIATPLDILFKELDDALSAFVSEMKKKELWDKVTIVCVSEFGRTLNGNTGAGTDHAWGNNYFVASGALDGGKIMGEYPAELANGSELVFTPGIVVPTTPWESVWSAVGEWFGVEDADLDKVLPNRGVFDDLWSAADFYLPNTYGSSEADAKSKSNIFE